MTVAQDEVIGHRSGVDEDFRPAQLSDSRGLFDGSEFLAGDAHFSDDGADGAGFEIPRSPVRYGGEHARGRIVPVMVAALGLAQLLTTQLTESLCQFAIAHQAARAFS